MKFLIDNALSPLLADGLKHAGYHASHVIDFKLEAADDEIIFKFAADKAFVLVSADTDFNTILALREETKPSLILFRKISQRRPQLQIKLLLANLPHIEESLQRGSIVVLEETRIRVRSLPVGGVEKK